MQWFILGWWIIGSSIAIYRYPPGGWKVSGWGWVILACLIWGLSGPPVIFIVAKRYRPEVGGEIFRG